MSNRITDERLDPNLRELLPKIRARDCILFLGAGISQDAGYAGSDEVTRSLCRETKLHMEVGEYISLSEAARTCEETRGYSRKDLVDIIKKALKPSPETEVDTEAFDLIAHIPQLGEIIITTNWDELMEKAIEKASDIKPVVVINEFDVGKTGDAKHVVYKIHGSLEQPDSVVITPEDYRDMYSRLRLPKSLLFSILRTLLAQKTVIYIGYSLTDPDFEVLLQGVQEALTTDAGHYLGKVGYAVMLPPGDASRRDLGQQQHNWLKKHIKVIWSTAREFCKRVFCETAEFVNREAELGQLTLQLIPKYSCLEVVGNAGSGKTRLLQEVVDQYKYEREWANVCYLDLKPRASVEEIDPIVSVSRELHLENSTLDDIARCRGLLLAFDSIEQAADGARRKVVELAEAISSTRRKDQRVIWATRYSLFPQLPLSIRNWTFPMRLSPFDETWVTDMVRRYIEVIGRTSREAEDYEELARAILHLVGSGHPGFVTDALEVLQQQKVFSPAYLKTEQGKKLILEALLKRIQADVLRGDEELSGFIEDTLCVLRGLTRDIVDKLKAKTSYENTEELFQAILGTHLWDERTYPLYMFDPVIRHVLVWYLREVQPADHFEEMNRWASDYFEELLPHVSEDLQRSYFREWLYHQALVYPPHRLFEDVSDEEQEDTFQKLKEGVEMKLELLESRHLERMRKKLVSEIRQDSELSKGLLWKVGDERHDTLLNIIGG